MDHSEYEYWGLKASTWNLFRDNASGSEDHPFYRELIQQSGEPALDVGCGTGRLLLDYRAHGIEIDGVDNSPEMLALCREKARQAGLVPRVFQQSMQTLDLPRRYRTIIVPSSSFQLLVDRADGAEAMHRFFRHLEPGGTLVMPFMVLYTGEAGEDTVIEDWKCTSETVRPSDGALVRIWSRTAFDLTQRLEHTQDRFEVIRDGQIQVSEEHARSPATRWYTQQEAVDLYASAGFTDIHVLHEFSFRPASADDTLFCILGTRPRGCPKPRDGANRASINV
jgi:ubiquinone/menaquinone biosynthesis C-methylase UbiE